MYAKPVVIYFSFPHFLFECHKLYNEFKSIFDLYGIYIIKTYKSPSLCLKLRAVKLQERRRQAGDRSRVSVGLFQMPATTKKRTEFLRKGTTIVSW